MLTYFEKDVVLISIYYLFGATLRVFQVDQNGTTCPKYTVQLYMFLFGSAALRVFQVGQNGPTCPKYTVQYQDKAVIVNTPDRSCQM